MSSSVSKENHELEPENSLPKLAAGIREEEFCRILSLKKNLDYSDVLTKYTSKYLSLGWHLIAVNSQGQTEMGLDFHQPEEAWSPRLMELGLDGVQVNLGIRTGVASGLLVLEVHRRESLYPFNQRGEWCSSCVAEVGNEREQHYYEIPPGWQVPGSFFLTSFQIMVFGEGGVVLAPPSLEPQAQTNLRWLKPPWENRPSQPTTLLKKFLTMIAPISESGPTVRAWEDIYPAVACHPPVLKALLAPAHSSTVYYQRLLETARRAGLQEASLLLGLLWHAPLGDAREQPQGLKNLQNLVEAAITPEDQDFWWEGEEKVRVPLPADQPEPVSSGASPGPLSSRPAAKEIQRLEPTAADPARYSPPAPPEGRPVSPDSPPWTVRDFTPGIQDMLRSYQDSLLVERQRYEAMIYELGKLGVWHEMYRRTNQENKLLREKLESQWQRELNYLRNLLKKQQ